MNTFFDIVLVVLFAFFAIKGYIRGFVKTVLGFGRLLLAGIVAWTLGGVLSDWLYASFIEYQWLASILGAVLMFALAFVALTVIINLISKLIKHSIFGKLDKLLGLLLGAFSGVVVVALVGSVFYAILWAMGTEITGLVGLINGFIF